jgi:hypothetical protein
MSQTHWKLLKIKKKYYENLLYYLGNIMYILKMTVMSQTDLKLLKIVRRSNKKILRNFALLFGKYNLYTQNDCHVHKLI